MIKRRSKAYWVKRNAALEKALQKDAEAAKERIINAYEKAIEDINADIHATFKAFVSNGVPEGEAKKLLNKAENDKLYTELLKLHDETDDPEIKNEILGRINAQAYGARISRLEGVKERAYIKLREAGKNAEKENTLLYTNTLQESYYTHIYNIAKGLNCGINFAVLPKRAIDRMLSEPWKGSNYSARLWKHNDNFISAVQEAIETGIIAGHGTRRMAEKLKEFVNGGSEDKINYVTERLCRSETSHFMNIGHLEAYKEADIEKYQFVAALSERTCDVCGNLDGEIFFTAEAMEGENYPPIHANCRCVTIMAGVIPDTRIARDPETGEDYKVDGNMTFKEWKNSLTPEQKEALKYVDKSAKSDIIKLGSGRMELNREVKRRESNIGAFQNLKIPMQKRSVLSVARKYNISTEGLTFKIQRSEKLLALPFYGSTDYDHIGRIDLFPNAFINEEQLVRTIIHEKCHVKQLNKYGKTYAIKNLDLMEKQAERFENLYYSILRKRVY